MGRLSRGLGAAAIGALAALLVASGWLASIERPVSDGLLRGVAQWAPPPPGDLPDLVLVGVDARSLRALPGWPWSRRIHAELIRRLDAAGAQAIGFDIDFSTPRDPQDDAALATALARSGRVALASFRQLEGLPGGGEIEIASRPAPPFAAAARGVGAVVMPLDPDGVLRDAPRSVEILGSATPSLAEVVLSIARGEAPTPARPGRVAIDYRRVRPPIRILSAVDVVEGRFDPREVAGRVVLVGGTAVEFQDLWATPLGPARPGVWIQAVAVRTLAAERAGLPVLRRAGPGMRIACLLLLSVLAAALGGMGHRRRVAGLGVLAVLVAGGSVMLLVTTGLLLEPLVPLAVLAAHYAFGLEGVRRRFQRDLVQRESSLSVLHEVGEASAQNEDPTSTEPLEMALALLADVVQARAVALLRADPEGRLDGQCLEWRRAGARCEPVGDPERAAAALESGEIVVVDGAPGLPRAAAEPEVVVYAPLRAGSVRVGVLVVERGGEGALSGSQLQTIATVGSQIALSAENQRLLGNLKQTFASSIEAIASAIEARDGTTESHCRRLSAVSVMIASRLGLPEEEIEAIRLGALLHDVGKIGIRDDLLLKPGKFDPEERRIMESHTEIGHRIVAAIHGLPPSAIACVRHHHERWDGGGYPDGLAGEAIPVSARIVSIVDCWDALSTSRPYKPAFSEEKVNAILRKGRGASFEPGLVDLFLGFLAEETDEIRMLRRGQTEIPEEQI